MAEHNDLGKYGESLAVDYLKAKGYRILETNWRTGRGEIDIIARFGEELIFVEVKALSDDKLADPEDKINQKKIRLIGQTAAFYIDLNEYEGMIRFDVVTVINRKNSQPVLRHMEDAFFPGKW